MTGFFDSVFALVFAAILNVLIVRRIRAVPGDGSFLGSVYVRTLLLRAALALFLNVYSKDLAFSLTFWGDSETYDFLGHQLSLYWSGDLPVAPDVRVRVSGWGFYYFVGSLYFFFGHNQLLVQLINVTIGSLTVLVIYAIAARLYDKEAARWAALLMAFFPQMVFWSAAMYKDPAILLCICLCMYSVFNLADRLSVRFVLLFVLASLALMTLRFYVFYMVVFATLGTFLLVHRKGVVRGFFSQLALLGIFVAAFSFAADKETVERQSEYLDIKRLQITRVDQARWGKSAFASGEDVTIAAGALAALPKGLAYLLFAPFPWAISGLRQALTVPETLVWYSLMPAFLRGLLFTLKHRLRTALPILVFATTLTCAYALFQGNVGTAYRQRTQITMFFFILMGVGIVEKRRQLEKSKSATSRVAFQE